MTKTFFLDTCEVWEIKITFVLYLIKQTSSLKYANDKIEIKSQHMKIVNKNVFCFLYFMYLWLGTYFMKSVGFLKYDFLYY